MAVRLVRFGIHALGNELSGESESDTYNELLCNLPGVDLTGFSICRFSLAANYIKYRGNLWEISQI